MNGDIFIIGGFSGAGKGTILQKIVKQYPELKLICSCTTRKRRDMDDKYIFLSETQFADWEMQGKFLETNVYGGYSYGTPGFLVSRAFQNGKIPLLEIDAKGMEKIKQSVYLAGKKIRSVFIAVSGPAILCQRLLGRKSESFSSILKRMEEAKGQCGYLPDYDCVIVNDKLEEAVLELESFILGGKPTPAFDRIQFLSDLDWMQQEIRNRGIGTLDELAHLLSDFKSNI